MKLIMTTIKRSILLLLSTVLTVFVAYPENNKPGMESDAPVLASKMIVGWNLGNSLEA